MAESRTRRALTVLVTAVLVAACGSDATLEVPEATAPTVSPPPAIDPRGEQLDLFAMPTLSETGFAAEADGSVVLLAKSGRPIGYLPGLTLDAELGTRLARPVISTADGRKLAVTFQGLVDLAEDFTLPVGGSELVGTVAGGRVSLTVQKGGQRVADLGTVAGLDDVRISATGSAVTLDSVGLSDPVAVATDTGASIAVPFGCWVSDQHDADTYFLCEPEGVGRTVGIRRAGGEVTRLFDPAPDGRWTSVQIGPDGETVLLNAETACGAPAAYFASNEQRELRPIAGEAAAIGLFFKADGSSWIGLPGESCDATDAEPGIYVYGADGSSRTLLSPPLPLRSAQMWLG